MALPSYLRSTFGIAKRLKLVDQVLVAERHCAHQSRTTIAGPRQMRTIYTSRQPHNAGKATILQHRLEDDMDEQEALSNMAESARGMILPLKTPQLPDSIQAEVDQLRLPRSVQLAYLEPLRRKATHNIPCADLQLRSYSVRNLEFMADFALRAAYYLKLPARGPVPLPKIIERYTVPKSNFAHKKSQENFERITLRRLVQVRDGHPETVQIWLAFLQKHLYYGVGMKANVWEHTGLDVGKDMDAEVEKRRTAIEQKLALFGKRKDLVMKRDVKHALHDGLFKGAYGGLGVMGEGRFKRM